MARTPFWLIVLNDVLAGRGSRNWWSEFTEGVKAVVWMLLGDLWQAQRQHAQDFDAHKIWPPRMWQTQRQDDRGEWVKKCLLRTVCLNSPKTRVMCYSLGRAEAHGMPRNVPLVRMVKKKENAIPGQVFSFMLCQRNVTSSFYCTFSSSRPCASCQTRQHNKRKLVHNKDLKRHAQRPNFYHVSCLRNLLYTNGMWGAVVHMYTV